MPARSGPNLKARPTSGKASAVMIVSRLVLTATWMAAHFRFATTPTLTPSSFMPFMVAMLVSMRYTYLKGRPNSVQAVFIGGITLILTLFFLGAGWITTKI